MGLRMIVVLLQGQYACIMLAHEDVEDDSHWIKWLRHAAQVDSLSLQYLRHLLCHTFVHFTCSVAYVCVIVYSFPDHAFIVWSSCRCSYV